MFLFSNEEFIKKFEIVFSTENLQKENTSDFIFVQNKIRRLIDGFDMDIWFDYKGEEYFIYIDVDEEGIEFAIPPNFQDETEKEGILLCIDKLLNIFKNDPRMKLYRVVNDLKVKNEEEIFSLKKSN